ncbi:MAG: threonylcarbamoyl-AMP synthase [Clostridiales bacterium]|nr:threonylcarbamoyl-AMP synthase [Clostridiales bacterium]
METKILNIGGKIINKELIKEASNEIIKGGVVAFPTETVYGLGADATNEDAIRKIFEAKGRPSDNPLIVHIADRSVIHDIVEELPEVATKLMDRFWPGPLTIIMKKKESIPYIVTAGLDTVGVRFPRNRVAIEFIKACGVPIAAPSANISGKPSPTAGKHVVDDLNGKVDCIIVSDDADVGVESTIIDVTVVPPIILRPGGITKEDIESLIGKVLLDKAVISKLDKDERPKAPGMKYRHYAPSGQVIIIKGDLLDIVNEINKKKNFYINSGKKVGILATYQTKKYYNNDDCTKVIVLGDRDNPETIAAQLFNALREFDKCGIDIILAEAIKICGIGMAIMNRMLKASGFTIIEV